MSKVQQRQQGIALATVVVFLIVLSIIGITGMRNTVLEQKMSSNMQDLNHAFQLAESGIVRAAHDVSILNTQTSVEQYLTVSYTSIYDNSVEDISLAAKSYYRGQGLSKGDTLETVNTLNTTPTHIFHVQTVGRYNSATSTHAQGVAILGPDSD